MICFIINSNLFVVNVMQLDDWVLCRIYKKNSSSQKVEANFLAMECSNGSSPSSSSHVDDMLGSLPEINDRCFTLPRVNSLRTMHQQDEKFGSPNMGSGFFSDWVNSTDLDSISEFESGCQTQRMVNYDCNDFFVPSLPPLGHVDYMVDAPLEEEVQSGVRTRRVDGPGHFQPNPDTRLLPGSGDPFGFGFIMGQQVGFGVRE